MYFKYGNFRHPDGLVNMLSLQRLSVYNPRGKLQLTRNTMQLQVTLIGAGATTAAMQSDLKSQIQALETAYGLDDRDAGLYHDDGSATPHYLNTSKSVGGVRVMSLGYEKSDGAEYATQRTASITLEADYHSGEQLVSFQETLRFTGTAGPKYVWVQMLNGPPQRQNVQQRTTQKITQSGSAVGFSAYPTAASPILPKLEHVDQREMSTDSPRRDGNRYIDWPISWTYHFESAAAVTARPHRR